MKQIYLILSLVMGWAAGLAQPKSAPQMDTTLSLIKETFELPGLAVGVLLDNEIYYSGALGVRDLKTQSPLTTTSLFHMASVSKPFAATAILQLVEAGKMSLEDKLVDYLPYFKMKDEAYKEITIKQILNHTSGIPDVQDYEWDNPVYDDQAAERYSKSFGNAPLDFKPGSDCSYSNASFDILADVISKVSGLTFEEYMKQHIFEPAGMINSTFFKPEVPVELATQPHGMGADLQIEPLDIYPYNRIHAPSSTLHSNVEDMLKWAMLYFNKGEINGNRIFSENSYSQLTTPTWEFNETRSVCLSWFRWDMDGKPMYYHSGGDDGYRTFFGFFPEEKAAVVVMGNNESLQSSKVAIHLIKQLVFKQPEVWKKYIHIALKNKILTEGVESCKTYYRYAQEHLSDQYEMSGGYLDQLGYWLLDRAKYDEALGIFLFNIELYPKESGFYDSVGDAYKAMEDKEKAIEWYEKALEINPQQDFTIRKLKELKG